MEIKVLFLVLFFYVLCVLIARKISYYAYTRGHDDDAAKNRIFWFIPIGNLTYIIVELIVILESIYHKKFKKINLFLVSFLKNNKWDIKKAEISDKKNEKLYEKVKDIDPFKEDNWEDN